MPNIQFTISPAPGISNALIAVIYNTIAPAAEIDRILKNPPHAAPHDFNFPNLAIGTYIVKIHESPDGITLGTLRHDFWVNAAIENVSAYTVKTFQVGAGRGTPYFDPAHEATNYINPDLNNLDYLVFKAGYGVLNWGVNIAPYPGGGFSLTDGNQFYTDEVYTILINNLIQNTSGVVTSAAYPAGVETISGNDTFTSAHYKKIIQISSVLNCTFTIPNLDTIPDGTVFSINTNALLNNDWLAPFRFATLSLNAGRFVRINGRDRSNLYLGRGESYELAKFGNYLHVLSGADAYRRVGQIVYSFSNPPANGFQLIGGWYWIEDVVRLYNEYLPYVDPAELGTGVADVQPDEENRTKWIINGGKVWIPDHGGRFHRLIDPSGVYDDNTRDTNDYQIDAVGPADVRTIAYTGTALGKNSLNNDGIGFLATHGDGGVITSDSAAGTNRNTARTGVWTIISPEGQTRPKNIAINAYVLV